MKHGQLTWHARGTLWFRLGIRLLLTILALFVLIRFGRPLLSLFAPFLLALGTAMLLNPLVKWFQKRLGWSRQLLTLFLVLLLLGLLGSALALLIYAGGQELLSLAQNWEGLLSSLQGMLNKTEEFFAQFWHLLPHQLYASVQSVTDGLLDWLNTATPTLLDGALDYTKDKAMGLPSFVVALVIYVMASFFLTVDYPYLRSRAAQSLDSGLLHFVEQVRITALRAFGGYLKAQLLLSAGVFVILLIGFFIVRQPYGLLLALGLSILDFIPIVGAGTVMIPWALISLFTGDFSTALEMMIIWGIIALYRRCLEPKFVGDQTGLSPILSLVSIYVGMKVAGVAGMILGPILLLVLINLASMGMFDGVRMDLAAAFRDVAAILSQRPEGP